MKVQYISCVLVILWLVGPFLQSFQYTLNHSLETLSAASTQNSSERRLAKIRSRLQKCWRFWLIQISILWSSHLLFARSSLNCHFDHRKDPWDKIMSIESNLHVWTDSQSSGLCQLLQKWIGFFWCYYEIIVIVIIKIQLDNEA